MFAYPMKAMTAWVSTVYPGKRFSVGDEVTFKPK